MRTRVWHTSSRVNPRCEWPGADDCGLASDGGVAPDKSAGAVRPAHVELAHAIPGLRNEIRLGSRDASSARRNPPRFNPRQLAWHNASRADIIESTPPRGGNAQTEVK